MKQSVILAPSAMPAVVLRTSVSVMSSCPENPEDAEERKCSICGDKNKENLLNAAICYVCE